MPSPMLQLGIYPVVLEPGRCALILFGFLCSWFSYLLVYSKPNPSVLRRTLIPNLNLLVRHSFSNSNDDEKKMATSPTTTMTTVATMMTTAATMMSSSKMIMTSKTLWQRQWWDDDGQQEARERCTTHPRQQSTHGDSWGGRRQERGRIVEDRMTEKGRGGSDLVETFELH